MHTAISILSTLLPKQEKYEYHFIFIKYKIQMVLNMNQGIQIAISVETDIGGMNKKGLKRMELIQT